jgi:fatty acid desaturase
VAFFTGFRRGAKVPTATISTAVPRDFRTLTTQVRSAGLLDRRPGYYFAKIVLTLAAFGGTWAAFFAVGGSWSTLSIAVLLGLISTQLAFLGHDAGHRQIFSSPRANRLLGLLIGNGLLGMSFGWWVPKHYAHHAHPNEMDRDPDIGVGLVGAPPVNNHVGAHRSLGGWLAQWQAELFFPLMLLRSTGLYVSGIQDLLRRRDRAAMKEGVLLAAHFGLYLTAVFWVLSPLRALAFIAIHQAVFSLYLGCSFAPNHKGMPLIDEGSEMSFARRQVITARNITGSRVTSFIFGGLNYQIEHHLFPVMPRPNLARAQNLVRAFCVENGFGYCVESPIGSYRQALSHLRPAAIPHLPSIDSRSLGSMIDP